MSLAFSFGVVVTSGLMDGELERFFPSGCFLFQLLGLPCLRSGGGRHGRQSLRAHPFFGTFAWCLFKSLLFPSYATRCRYDVPGVFVSGSGLSASACSYACGRFLRIPRSWCWLSIRLFLVEGSSDGSAPGDRFLSLGGCVHSRRFGLRSVASVLSLLGSGLFFLL